MVYQTLSWHGYSALKWQTADQFSFSLRYGPHEMTLDHSFWGQHWPPVRYPPCMQVDQLMPVTVQCCASPCEEHKAECLWVAHPVEKQGHLAYQLIYSERENQIRWKLQTLKQRQVSHILKNKPYHSLNLNLFNFQSFQQALSNCCGRVIKFSMITFENNVTSYHIYIPSYITFASKAIYTCFIWSHIVAFATLKK